MVIDVQHLSSGPALRSLVSTLFVVTLTSLPGCSQPLSRNTAIKASEDWFTCQGRFECVVVYDAFCKKVAVNSRYALVYQDWAREVGRRVGERTLCPDPEFKYESAGCRENRCVYPFSWEDYADNPGAK